MGYWNFLVSLEICVHKEYLTIQKSGFEYKINLFAGKTGDYRSVNYTMRRGDGLVKLFKKKKYGASV